MPCPKLALAVSASYQGRPCGRFPRQRNARGLTEPEAAVRGVERGFAELQTDLESADVRALGEDLRRGQDVADVGVVDGDTAHLVDAVLAVDEARGLERPRGQGARDEERLHDRSRLEAVGHGAVASPVDVALRVVVGVVAGHAGEGEQLPGRRIDHHERSAARLVGAHRRVELALGHVLDPFVDREHDVVALHRVLVARALEDEAPSAVAKTAHVFDLAAQILLERQLEPVLALSVGRDEPEQGACELARRVVAMTFALDRDASKRTTRLFLIRQIVDRAALVARDPPLDPDEAVARRELGVDVIRLERESVPDARGRIAQRRLLGRRAVDSPEHLDDVGADARDLDAHRQRRPVSVVHRPALRLDVESTQTLTLGHVPPFGAVFDLDAPRAGDHPSEGEGHHAAQDPHSRADPSGATGIEVLHRRPSSGLAGAGASAPSVRAPRGSALGLSEIVTMRSGRGGSIPSSVRATISTRSGVL